MQFNASENDRVTVAGNTDFYNATQGAIMFWMRSSGTYGTSGDGAVLVDYRTTSGMQISQTNAGQIRVRCVQERHRGERRDLERYGQRQSMASRRRNLQSELPAAHARSTSTACSTIKASTARVGLGVRPPILSKSVVARLATSPALTMKNYNGLLDDIRFYNAPLASTDIANIAKGMDETVSSSDVGLNVTTQMQNVNSSAFIRIPFTIADAGSIDNLLLSIRFNDGFIAWINGVQVAAVNAPGSPAWNSAATDVHSPNRHVARLDRRSFRPASDRHEYPRHPGLELFRLRSELPDPAAIVRQCHVGFRHGRESISSRLLPESANGSGTADLGPIVTDVSEPATQPAAGVPIVVTAQVSQTINPIQSDSVTLHYRVMYNTEYTVLHVRRRHARRRRRRRRRLHRHDSRGTATAGQMLRWYVTAADTLAHSGRWPLLVPMIGNDGGPEYEGTVIADPALTSTLPIFQSFIVNPSAADNWSDRTGTRGSVLLPRPILRQCIRPLPRRLHHATATSSSSIPATISLLRKIKTPSRQINLNQQGWDETYARPDVVLRNHERRRRAGEHRLSDARAAEQPVLLGDELHRAVRQASSEAGRALRERRDLQRLFGHVVD